MLDKIVVSQDRKSATVITDEKTYTLYHSDGQVVALVNEFVLEPMARSARMDEDTQIIEIDNQLSFPIAA